MYGQGVTRGRVAVLKIEAAINQAVAAISPNNKVIDSLFLFYQPQGLYEHLRNISESRGGNQSNLNAKMIKELAIAIPTLEIQHEIVANLEKGKALVNANKELIEIFEGKIKERIAKVGGRLRSPTHMLTPLTTNATNPAPEFASKSATNPTPKSPKGDLESAAEELPMVAESEAKYSKSTR